MPGFTTHYLFGVQTYQRMEPDELRSIIRKNHRAFSLGLQGPDIFFYYLPSYFLHKENIGALAHDNETGAFIVQLIQSRKQFWGSRRKRDIADAYLCGFIGHYTLDCVMHPYVYAFTNYDPENKKRNVDYFGQHAYFETELDTQLLWHYKHMRPTEFHQDATIRLSAIETNVIARMLAYAYKHTYHVSAPRAMMRGAIRWMRTGTRLTNDPSGQKKVLVRLVEKYALDHAFISPMLPSNRYRFVKDPLNIQRREWRHPWTKETTTDTFADLLVRAQSIYKKRLGAYETMRRNGFSGEWLAAFLNEYGNCSFLSGQRLS